MYELKPPRTWSCCVTTRWWCQVNHQPVRGCVATRLIISTWWGCTSWEKRTLAILDEYLRGIKETDWVLTHPTQVDIQGHCEKRRKKTPLRLWAQQQQLLHPSWINYRHLNHSLCLLKLSWRGNASCADSTNYTLLEVFKRRFVLTVIIKEATQEKELTLQKQRTAQGNLHVRLFHKTDFNPSV